MFPCIQAMVRIGDWEAAILASDDSNAPDTPGELRLQGPSGDAVYVRWESTGSGAYTTIRGIERVLAALKGIIEAG